jgi:hypothetical protein
VPFSRVEETPKQKPRSVVAGLVSGVNLVIGYQEKKVLFLTTDN